MWVLWLEARILLLSIRRHPVPHPHFDFRTVLALRRCCLFPASLPPGQIDIKPDCMCIYFLPPLRGSYLKPPPFLGPSLYLYLNGFGWLQRCSYHKQNMGIMTLVGDIQ